MIALTNLGFVNDILVGLGIEQVTALTDPGMIPFLIANGNWRVLSTGNQVNFLSAQDGNIWLLEIP